MGCVSPIYETAEIEPGFHLTGGLGVSSYGFSADDFGFYGVGPRVDILCGYGLARWLDISARLGVGVGTDLSDFMPLIDGAAGAKLTYQCKYVQPVFKFEISPVFYAPWQYFPSLLLGIKGRDRNEVATLGVRVIFTGESSFEDIMNNIDIMGMLHFSKRYTVFGGVNISGSRDHYGIPIPMSTLGIAYRFDHGKD